MNQEDVEALKVAWTKLNYEEFCMVIDNIEDYWAMGKWVAFKALMSNLNELGTLLPKLIEYGKQERQSMIDRARS